MSKTAVVMGGSLAGLMAARVLTERFEHVIVLERDRCLPSAPHAGVPQAHHVHVLLVRGLQILDALFPGFSEELIREGGLLLDSARDFHWFTPAGWAPRFTSGLPFLAVSRPLLESTVRRRVAQLSAVSMREGASATGLSIDKSLRRITGVCAEPDGFIPASLVIDAMGRASHLPKWIERLGYARPGGNRGRRPPGLREPHLSQRTHTRARLARGIFTSRAARLTPNRRGASNRRRPLDGHPRRRRQRLSSRRGRGLCGLRQILAESRYP